LDRPVAYFCAIWTCRVSRFRTWPSPEDPPLRLAHLVVNIRSARFRCLMPTRGSTARNDYRCSIERNQNGKYCVRIHARYPRHAWSLGVFSLPSSFARAMKKLEEALDFLQRHEENLWFWGVARAADMGFSAEFLREAGLKLARRTEFPPKAASLSLAPE